MIRFYNPQIEKPTIWDKTAGRDELSPDDDIWLCPPAMQKITIWDQVIDPSAPKGQGPANPVPIRDRTSSPASTQADYEASMRAGELFVVLADGKVKMRLGTANLTSEIGKWLAARNYGPDPAKPVSAKSIAKRVTKELPHIEFLSPHYPADTVEDPLFGDDPRYPKHIIKRPP